MAGAADGSTASATPAGPIELLYNDDGERDTTVTVVIWPMGDWNVTVDQRVVFANGVIVSFGSDSSTPLPLPPGATLLEECCLDPCCTE